MEFKEAQQPLLSQQINRRMKCQQAAQEHRATVLAAAISNMIQAAIYPCNFCRDLPRGAQNLKHGCGELYGLVEDHESETVKCPKCGKLLAQWDY